MQNYTFYIVHLSTFRFLYPHRATGMKQSKYKGKTYIMNTNSWGRKCISGFFWEKAYSIAFCLSNFPYLNLGWYSIGHFTSLDSSTEAEVTLSLRTEHYSHIRHQKQDFFHSLDSYWFSEHCFICRNCEVSRMGTVPFAVSECRFWDVKLLPKITQLGGNREKLKTKAHLWFCLLHLLCSRDLQKKGGVLKPDLFGHMEWEDRWSLAGASCCRQCCWQLPTSSCFS